MQESKPLYINHYSKDEIQETRHRFIRRDREIYSIDGFEYVCLLIEYNLSVFV